MNKAKIAIILICLSLISTFHTSAFAEYSTSDDAIELTEMSEFKKLEAFGIVSEDDDLIYYNELTRGLFVFYAVKFCVGADALSDEGQYTFPYSDVNINTDYAQAINIAYKYGLIDGAAGSSFRPDDNISVAEASKILLTILGYKDYAEVCGGYPSGYLAQADKLGIFDNCTFTDNGEIPVKSFVTMLLNTLETDVMNITAIEQKFGEEKAIYSTVKGKSLLEYVYGIYKAHGIVDSNRYTSLNGPSILKEGYISIDKISYKMHDISDIDMLGLSAECYYKLEDNDNVRSIVYLGEYKDNNEIYVVNSKNIDASNVTKTDFSYYDEINDKYKTLKIKKSAVMTYNGKQKSISEELLCPKNGTVTLIDNDNDNTADVVKVMDYCTMVVGSTSKNTFIVTDILNGMHIELDASDNDYDIFITKDGQKAEFDEISSEDVISYAESSGTGANIKYVNISSKKIEGILDSISDDAVVISGEEYPVMDFAGLNLQLGNNATFYLDFNGYVVYSKYENDVVYGYLNGLEKSNFDKITAQIFTENNRWVELEFKEKINYNFSKNYSSAKFYDDCMSMENFRQLISYTVNEDGMIQMIKTAEQVEPYSEEEKSAIDNNTFRVLPEIEKATYRSGMQSFDNDVIVGSDTKIFMIPKQENGMLASKEDFWIMPASSLYPDTIYNNIKAYDTDMLREAKAVVITGSSQQVNPRSNMFIVKKMTKLLDESGTPVDGIKGYYRNAEVTIPVESSSVLDQLGTELDAGDIVQFDMNSTGSIKKLILQYDYSKGTNQGYITNNLYSYATFASGKIYYADYENGKFVLQTNDQKIVFKTSSNVSVYVYNNQRKNVVQGSLADLSDGSDVFLKMAYYSASEIIVFR